MAPNAFVLLPLVNEPKVRPIRPPRGNLLEFGINPFTYNIVMSYQDNKMSLSYIQEVIFQLHDQILAMEDLGYPPTLEALIDYIKDGNTPPTDPVIKLNKIA